MIVMKKPSKPKLPGLIFSQTGRRAADTKSSKTEKKYEARTGRNPRLGKGRS